MNNLLFENGEETVYLQYISANFAKNYFKSKIEELDVTNIYVSSKEILGISETDFEEAKEKYDDKKKLMDEKLKTWKEEHIEYYRVQTCLPTSSEYSICIPDISLINDSLEHEITLYDAVQGYKCANAILKLIKNSDLDKYCIDNKLMINKEHSEEYKKIKQQYKEQFNIPSDEEIKSTLTEKLITKTRLCLNRLPAENNIAIDIFLEKFVNNIKNV